MNLIIINIFFSQYIIIIICTPNRFDKSYIFYCIADNCTSIIDPLVI